MMNYGVVGRLLIAIALASSPSFAATYYIDPVHGDNSANGQTEATAWKTIRQAVVHGQYGQPYQPGDQILLKAGSTFTELMLTFARMGSGTADRPIVFGMYGTGAKPVIAPTADNHAFSIQDLSHWTIQDLDLRRGTPWSSTVAVEAKAAAVTGIKILRCDIDSLGTGKFGIQVMSDKPDNCPITHLEIGHCHVKNTNPTGNCDGMNLWYVSNLWVHHNTVHSFGDKGQGIDVAGGTDSIVEHNAIWDGLSGGKFHREDNPNFPMTRMIWRHNTFHTPRGQWTFGFAMEDASDSQVLNNTVVMGKAGIGAFYVMCEYRPPVMKGNTVRNNIFSGCFAREGWTYGTMTIDGISLDDFVSKNTIDHNLYDAPSAIWVRFLRTVPPGVPVAIADQNWAALWQPKHEGDLKGDPKLDENLRPLPGSPAIGAGYGGATIGAHKEAEAVPGGSRGSEGR